ncbi:hypothetical protein U1Q18_028450 [Sarracenia purpurea var. burkii]
MDSPNPYSLALNPSSSYSPLSLSSAIVPTSIFAVPQSKITPKSQIRHQSPFLIRHRSSFAAIVVPSSPLIAVVISTSPIYHC